MAGDREAAPESRGTIAEHAATPSSAGGGSAIAAAAHAVRSGPAQVANVLRQFPAQRDAIIGWLHATCGNAYVQAVLTHRAPEEGPAWDIVATPQIVQFPETEVGAVSPPRTVVLANRGQVAIDIESLELVRHGGTGASAYPGEFELIQGQAGQLRPLETMAVQVVFRPTRVVTYIGARLRAKGHGAHDHVDVILKAVPSPARPDHADQRELSVAQHAARRFETTGTPSVQHYGDMLAAVLAARTLTDSAEADDTTTHARVTKLLEPVARRLDQLNDHQGRLAQFGAGNIAGQAALDMSESAVRSWLQRLALGARVRSEELVTKFRAGAEPIRFLTEESADAPTLRAFDHASRMVGVGAAALVMAPPLIALAAEEAALLVFAGRLASQRVAAWALANPAAALAASEGLLGFGVQIGEDGWEAFWDQLQDPQGRWFIIAQVFMDYMHVKSGMGHGGPSNGQRATGVGAEPVPEPARAPDLDAARQRAAKVRAILQQIHDAAAATSDSGSRSPRKQDVATVGTANGSNVQDYAEHGLPPQEQPRAARHGSEVEGRSRSATTTDRRSDAAPVPGKRVGAHKLSSGIEDGIDPTPESVRQGTVRMEQHPDFLKVVGELEVNGYKIKYAEVDPHVEIREVLTPDGTLIRLEKVVVVQQGMRFLDLEHELGHVEQIQRFKQPLVTERVLENGRPYRGPDRPGLLTKSLDAITEYHNRLVEYFRLKARGVGPEIIQEHAAGVRAARSAYRKQGIKGGRAQSNTKFIQENLPDLPDLDTRFVTQETDP